jgi:hypothetical protein
MKPSLKAIRSTGKVASNNYRNSAKQSNTNGCKLILLEQIAPRLRRYLTQQIYFNTGSTKTIRRQRLLTLHTAFDLKGQCSNAKRLYQGIGTMPCPKTIKA